MKSPHVLNITTNADSLTTELTDMMSLSDEERGVCGDEWVRATFVCANYFLRIFDVHQKQNKPRFSALREKSFFHYRLIPQGEG